MYDRKIRLLRILVGNERVSSEELMNRLRIGQRTLRSEITELNETLSQQGVSIHAGKSGGYYICREDVPVIKEIIRSFKQANLKILLPETPEERILFAWVSLSFQGNPISLQTLADALKVSRTAMNETKQAIKEIAAAFDGLRLETSSHGIMLQGPEALKRHALVEIINYRTFGANLMERVITFLLGSEEYRSYKALHHAVPAILRAYAYALPDKEIEEFVLDAFMSVVRTERGFALPDAWENDGRTVSLSADLRCVRDVCACLDSLGHSASEADMGYIAHCLALKRAFWVQGRSTTTEAEWSSLVESYLNRVDGLYGTAFSSAPELKDKLTVHIKKAVGRLQAGYNVINPALEQVQAVYPREMRMAAELNALLLDRYGVTANEHELAYIALYLAAHVVRTVTAVVLCDLGQSVADGMASQIDAHCGKALKIVGCMSLADYRAKPLAIDLLISASRVYDVEVPQQTTVVYVNYVLTKEDFRTIQSLASERPLVG